MVEASNDLDDAGADGTSQSGHSPTAQDTLCAQSHREGRVGKERGAVTLGVIKHADFGGSGECGYHAAAGALALASGTTLEKLRVQLARGATNIRVKIT